ncbi:protein translocase subunit secF [Plasticicumulans lactativorans]|uniref:Protein-export membrane protein SecF n=1 Tax=Plasticicumulans lactativorans TaxID=1133106 RepID=A0A4R2LAF4_9GAMM|nr:protein translocase subunit SecF [Plasticicumulans lactativorans]TCO82397.1 protein translocase subunit secF [Plasticicumulans lactativorans]
MRLLPKKTNIDFLRYGKLCVGLSIALLLGCIVALVLRGLNFGLDFTGGTLIEARYSHAVEIPQVREALREAGFGDAQTQYFGSAAEVLIRVPPREGVNTAEISTRVLEALRSGTGNADAEIRKIEFVGPQVGNELVQDGALAALIATLGILVYVAFRFEWRLAVGAIAATVHDVVFCIGVFALWRIEFDLTTLAAVLAVIGYSVNDTVVVFDRIRENFRNRAFSKATTKEVINASINETLARTIMTSMTTLLAVIVLLGWGGPAIHTFSLTMVIGVVVGTYSSIYIASATPYFLGLKREDLLPRAKEDLDHIP